MLYARGRNKRWEYWNVITPTHVLALTVSDIDYAGVHEVWLLDRASGEAIGSNAISPLAARTSLPGTLGNGPVRARAGDLTIAVDEVDGGTRLRAVTSRPFHLKESRTALGVLSSDTLQLFGHYDGWMSDSAGQRVPVERLTGWAEDVFNRW